MPILLIIGILVVFGISDKETYKAPYGAKTVYAYSDTTFNKNTLKSDSRREIEYLINEVADAHKIDRRTLYNLVDSETGGTFKTDLISKTGNYGS